MPPHTNAPQMDLAKTLSQREQEERLIITAWYNMVRPWVGGALLGLAGAVLDGVIYWAGAEGLDSRMEVGVGRPRGPY